MIIYLDTNIFGGSWNAEGVYFDSLFNYVNYFDQKIVLSEIVLMEINNKRKDRFIKAKSNLIEFKRVLESFTLESFELPLLNSIPIIDFGDVLSKRVKNLEIISMPSIGHLDVLQRIFDKKRPFQESEKGYRDYLIWLSLTEYVKSIERSEDKKIEDIVFISDNHKDFYAGKNPPLRFHDDLISDFSGNSWNIIPCESLVDFVKKHKDAIDSIPKSNLQKKSNSDGQERAKFVIEKAKIDEGTNIDEDLLINSYKDDFEDFLMEHVEANVDEVKLQINEYILPNQKIIINSELLRVDIYEGIEKIEIFDIDKRLYRNEINVSCAILFGNIGFTFSVERSSFDRIFDGIDPLDVFEEIDYSADKVMIWENFTVSVTASFDLSSELGDIVYFDIEEIRIPGVSLLESVGY